MISIEVLISTYGSGIENIFNSPPIEESGVRYIIVHQVSSDYMLSSDILETINVRPDIQYYELESVGLSKSRNYALSKASSELVLFCDDDVKYVDGAFSKIRQAFIENSDADIITFKVMTPEGEDFKTYPPVIMRHNKRTVFKISSIEVAARRNSLLGLEFDEMFGLGSIYPASEENIFLMDALSSDKLIMFVPVAINFHPYETSGKNWANMKMSSSKLVFMFRCFGWFSLPIFIAFAVKKHSEYKRDLSLMKMIAINIDKLYGYLNNA